MTPTMFIDGQAWVPRAAYDELAEKLREKQRSQQAHNHQFAALTEAWENLPASHAGAPYAASAEAFRKHALIVTGHCDTATVSFSTQEQAMDAAPYIAELARKAHGYALVSVRGPLVICATPHSQSYRAMGKERFQRSKDDCLSWAYQLLGVAA